MNRYEKIRKIGEGAFGKAYLMKEKSSGNQVVVKETNLSKLPPKEREDARRETAVLAQLKHPAIVTYHDSFEEVGNLYIVMDYCDGGDLAAKINAQHGRLFSEDEILDWIVQLCLAVKHIHDRNILHRDIKCQNIFLTRTGQIKLGDFGIAKILDSTVQLSHTLIGTPYYFSPEICMGRPYNHKSDMWSLGCVFYELATLRHAFDGQNLRAVMQKIQNGTPQPISRSYTRDLQLLISSILKKNPRDRPSANTLLQRPVISRRINKFLTEEQYATEFSHTVLHGERLLKQLPRGNAGRGVANGANARRPQSAQTPQARANSNQPPSPASNIPAQRPSTAAEGQRQQQNVPMRNRPSPIDEDEAAVRGLPNSSDSDSYRDPYAMNNQRGRQESPRTPAAAALNNNNIPAFRPMPFPGGSRGGERGNYNNYLEFLRQLDVRRQQALYEPAQLPAQPINVQPRVSPQQHQPVHQPQQQQQPQQRPSTAQQNGRNNGPGRPLIQNAAKRPSSANVAAAPPRNAFVRPMRNIPPSNNNNNNKRPPIINRDQMVFDRLQRIRQQNLRSRNAMLAAAQQRQQTPLAANNRPPSAVGKGVIRQPSAEGRQRQQQQPPAASPIPQQQQSPSFPVASNLTEALRIVQVPGIPASPRVPASVAAVVAPRLTDALKAVTPREEPAQAPAIKEPALPIDQQQLRKMRQAELQKANANPPIIIGDRPYWLPNQSISDDLASLTPEMTGSKMVSTVENKPGNAARKPWNIVAPKDAKGEDDTFVVAKSVQQNKRPAWRASKDVENSTAASIMSTKEKLATGQFDASDFKLLRTCSLPSLAGDDSPPASTVSTLELLRASTPVSARGILTSSVSELNRTIGLSTSTPDLLNIVSPSLMVNESIDVDGETLKLDGEKKSENHFANPSNKAVSKPKVAWSNNKPEPKIEAAVSNALAAKKRTRTRQSTNSSYTTASSTVVEEQPRQQPENVRLSIATTVDEDVDNVSKSMMNLLIGSPSPQENDAKLKDFRVSVEPEKSNNKTKNEPMNAILEQLTINTESMTSSVSSIDGGALVGGSTDVSKLLEELEKINGPESPPMNNNSNGKNNSNGGYLVGSSRLITNPIEVLVSQSTLLDTLTLGDAKK